MQQGDGGSSEMNGGEKCDQPSQTSSSREMLDHVVIDANGLID
jgi:hypothetical protein